MTPKPETVFRTGKVLPFLKTLKNTISFPIQQMSFVGDPDFLLCCRGLFVALELKSGDEEPRPLQRHKLAEVERTGGKSLVARPKNWESIKLLLRHLDGGNK